MLLLYILWDDWPIFMISASNEQLQQKLEYTLLKPDCHSWWISKTQSDIRDSRKASLWRMVRGVGGVRKSEHQRWLAKGLGLGLLCFKGVQEEIPSDDVNTLQIGSVAFGYSLSSEAVVMRRLRLWRRWLTRSNKRTSMGRSRSCWNSSTRALQLEEITSMGTRVSCVCSQ